MYINEQAIQEQQTAVQEWARRLDDIHARIGPRFARAEQRRRVRIYLQGLLSPLERKNGWQLAEAAGEANPYGMQEFLSRAKWDADALRDDLLELVKERLADPLAVLVIDETGFLKKGTKSVGVAPQYSGTAGKVANCQIGVFLAYASRHGQVLLDRALYLPQDWALNQQRRKEAGVPAQVGFATKLELARRMVERVIAAEVPVAWVTGDSIYGADYQLRHWLAEQRIPSVLAVASNHMIRTSWQAGRQSMRVDQFMQQPKRLRWSRHSAGQGAKGPRLYDWAWRALQDVGPTGWAAWIVARRSRADVQEMAYYHVCAPKHTTLEQIVQVAGQRWKVEEAIERAKSDCGLDQYEVRSWTGWYRHITLAMLSLLGATFMQGQANAGPGKKERGDPFQTGSLQAFKKRRGLALT